jgi:hypothetical protein
VAKMAAAQKGSSLEELVRAYFFRQGFFALRGVSLQFEDEEVTDIDVWLYGKQSASVRTRSIVDVKDKRSPKAFERILWTRGLQLSLGCDRAIVATTDSTAKTARFAQQQRVALLTKSFLERLQKGLSTEGRLANEDFSNFVREYPGHKQDGDWLKKISDAKSAVVSLAGYPAFNKTMVSFRFFAGRAETRPQHREQAIRCAYFSAALACIALDSALEKSVYEDLNTKFAAIANGVTYGDSGDAKVQTSIDTVLSVLSTAMENGRVVSMQARNALTKLFEGVRADIIAEYFSKEHNSTALFSVARELDEHAHVAERKKIQELTTEAKSMLGIFADFTRTKRGPLLNGGFGDSAASAKSKADDAQKSNVDKAPDVEEGRLL